MKSSRMRKYLSRRGENPSAIRESDVLSSVPGDRTGVAFLVSRVIIRCEEFTVVGEEGVIKGGGDDILAVSGGGIGQARGEG